ncbi:MAG TPA: trimeric intracellular cation channel family protein [Opitutaceae bacterium]|jgi:uncharacterized membrane protein YeiH|nr:trimeric intracellular cation channel family protein [Opitutaceae bacterium]
MPSESFQIPIAFDLGATVAFALTGAMAARRRGYDIVGLFFLALASGLGGGLIRDGLFIQQGPPALMTDGRYLWAVLAGGAAGVFLGDRLTRLNRAIAIIDAVGLGAYAVVGVQKSLAAGLAVPAAILVGVINAAGGGVLRDVLTREEPLVFKPGQFYVLIALAGALVFVVLRQQTHLSTTGAALIAIGLTFLLRILTILFNWKTSALASVNTPDRSD